MNDTKVPTLQSLSIKGVLILLWSRDDTKRLIESKLDSIFHEDIKEWEQVEDKIKQDILSLFPKQIANEFGDHLRPIGLELLAWIEFHFYHVQLKPKIPDKISWTSKGSIDLLKTAEILIKDESLGLYDRYKLACAFCLETPIRELWERVDQNEIKQDEYGLVLYWSHWNQREVPKAWKTEIVTQRIDTDELLRTDIGRIENLEDWGLRCSVQSANITATKYFFEKLKENEREKIFYVIQSLLPYRKSCNEFKWTKGYFVKKYCFDFFIFAGTDLSEEQNMSCTDFSISFAQPGFLRSFTVKTSRFPDSESVEDYLTGFLDWPFQEILLNTAILVSNGLPTINGEEIYSGILLLVFKKIIKGHDDHDYILLFKKFWDHLLPSQKKYICNSFVRVWMKVDFEKFVQARGISFNFEDWVPFDMDSAKEVESIGRHCDGSHFGLFEFYVLACMCPRDIIISYKEDYKKRILEIFALKFSEPDRMDARTLKWYKFFENLDEFIEHEEAGESFDNEYYSPVAKRKRNKFRIISDRISVAVSNITKLFNKMKIRK